MDRATRRSLSVLVDNEAGVLSQVSRLFSRKGYNIESLAVGTTDDPAVSRITIEVLADDKQITLLSNQLRKLLPVHSVKLLNSENAIRREIELHTGAHLQQHFLMAQERFALAVGLRLQILAGFAEIHTISHADYPFRRKRAPSRGAILTTRYKKP